MPSRSLVLLASFSLVSCASNGDGTGGSGGAPTSTSSSDVSTGPTTSASTASSSASSGGADTCGDEIIGPGETCEGDDFGGKTCASFGLTGGTLACNGTCNVVLSGCSPPETCANQADDDGDGLVDCDDPDCGAALACSDSCLSPSFVSVPAMVPADMSGLPNDLSSSCMPTAGREMVYEFVAPADETLLVKVEFPAFDAGVAVRTDCGDPSSEVACANAAVNGEEHVILPVQAGQTYYVIVESVSDQVGFYQLTIEELLPESGCNDFVDDDLDGYVDCDDAAACQGSAACTPGMGAVGAPCTDNPDCAANRGDPVCLQGFLGYANGYCSEFCDLQTNDCPSGTECVDLGLSVDGVCLDGCVTTADCRPGYACVDYGLATKVCDRQPEFVCDDGKDNDKDGLVDCEDATACGASPSCAPGPGAVGTPCQLHNQCSADQNDPFCIDQFNFSWPGGYCTEFCNLSADDCPAGSACSSWISFVSGNGLCFETCTAPSDCPLGFDCQSDGAHLICVL